jgi:hypothetical protein
MAAGVWDSTYVCHTRIFTVEDTQELDEVVILRLSQVLLPNPRKQKWQWELFYIHFPFSFQYISFIRHRWYLILAVDSVVK